MKFKTKYYKNWHKKFAWLPKTLNDGVIIWLESYEIRYQEKGEKCDCGCRCPIVGWWEHKYNNIIYSTNNK